MTHHKSPTISVFERLAAIIAVDPTGEAWYKACFQTSIFPWDKYVLVILHVSDTCFWSSTGVNRVWSCFLSRLCESSHQCTETLSYLSEKSIFKSNTSIVYMMLALVFITMCTVFSICVQADITNSVKSCAAGAYESETERVKEISYWHVPC